MLTQSPPPVIPPATQLAEPPDPPVIPKQDMTDPEPGEVKPAWYWIKDTKGYGSVTVTMVFVSFWVTTLAYIASTIEKIGGVQIRTFDVAACSVYFIPIMTLYFGRKWTDANAKNKA